MNALTETFLHYFKGLKAAVAPNMSMSKERFEYVNFIWHYVFRLHRRLNILITQWANGTLPQPGAPRPAPRPAPDQGQTRAARTPPKFRFPSRRRWLFHVLPGNGYIRSQLQHLIATDPEFAAFLEAAPQARRMLNPLCRMLGIDLDAPYGVPLLRVTRVKPKASPESQPESAATAPQPPPGRVECSSHSTDAAPNPTIFFSTP